MAGFGGAIKNISIGFGSSMGKVWIHSGGSGLGGSMKHLEEQAGAGTWLEGRRFDSRTTVEELTDWAASLGIKP